MADETKRGGKGKGEFEKSLLFREFQAEREEVLRHKWLESEKAGRDIGYQKAFYDWLLRHRTQWRRSRRSRHA